VDPDRVVAAVEEGMRKTGYNEFSLLSLSCSDYLSLPSVGIEVWPLAAVPRRTVPGQGVFEGLCHLPLSPGEVFQARGCLKGYAMLLRWPPSMTAQSNVIHSVAYDQARLFEGLCQGTAMAALDECPVLSMSSHGFLRVMPGYCHDGSQ
jgi:hypothetical protein